MGSLVPVGGRVVVAQIALVAPCVLRGVCALPPALVATMGNAGISLREPVPPCLRDFDEVFAPPFGRHSGLHIPERGPLPEVARHQAFACECRERPAEYLLVRLRLREYLRRHAANGRWVVRGNGSGSRRGLPRFHGFGICVPLGCAGEDHAAPSPALRALILWFVFVDQQMPRNAQAPLLGPADVAVRRCCRPPYTGDSLADHFGGIRGSDYTLVSADAYCPRIGARPSPPGGRAPRAFVTYVSPRRQMYRDGAVMLGLSLGRHAAGVPRIALVEDFGSEMELASLCALLEPAGWHVWPVAARHPPNAPHGSLDGSYAKVEVFRFAADEAVYLDSDSWVRGPEVLGLFDAHRPEPLAMVRDCNWGYREEQYNGGILAVRPDDHKFDLVNSYVMQGIHNDQWAINGAYYRHEIYELPPRFNVHCWLIRDGIVTPEEAVVVHFTGLVESEDGTARGKPALADAGLLRQVRYGRGLLFGSITGGESLYQEYFADMTHPSNIGFLSPELQSALRESLSR